jgi:hypothetical protein
MKRTALALAAVASIATAGCFEYGRKSTGPTTNLSELAGDWASGDLGDLANSCGNFRWNVTEYTGSTAAGSFGATCRGNLNLDGTARGELVGSVINWSAAGIASAPGMPSCAISLNGTATLKDDRIEVPYSGNTCLGPVSGTEILTKR